MTKEVKKITGPELAKPEMPEFGMMSKEELTEMANFIVSLHPKEFKMFFAIQKAMGTKVTVSDKG